MILHLTDISLTNDQSDISPSTSFFSRRQNFFILMGGTSSTLWAWFYDCDRIEVYFLSLLINLSTNAHRELKTKNPPSIFSLLSNFFLTNIKLNFSSILWERNVELKYILNFNMARQHCWGPFWKRFGTEYIDLLSVWNQDVFLNLRRRNNQKIYEYFTNEKMFFKCLKTLSFIKRYSSCL